LVPEVQYVPVNDKNAENIEIITLLTIFFPFVPLLELNTHINSLSNSKAAPLYPYLQHSAIPAAQSS
jgi:hypothetical protein